MLRQDVHEVIQVKAEEDHSEGVSICQNRVSAFTAEDLGRGKWAGARMNFFGFERPLLLFGNDFGKGLDMRMRKHGGGGWIRAMGSGAFHWQRK